MDDKVKTSAEDTTQNAAAEAVKAAGNHMPRDTYKRIKRMNHAEMEAYFIRVYQRGYNDAMNRFSGRKR